MSPEIPDTELDALEERLDHLQEGIDEVRHKAQGDRVIPGLHERTLADPGDDEPDDEPDA